MTIACAMTRSAFPETALSALPGVVSKAPGLPSTKGPLLVLYSLHGSRLARSARSLRVKKKEQSGDQQRGLNENCCAGLPKTFYYLSSIKQF